jgi:NADPH:quinone reductase-like Zn-dependent oxidoreductase
LRVAAFSKYGPPETLAIDEWPKPTAGEGKLLIRVTAAGVNPLDCRIRSGELRLVLRTALPFVPGTDVAGIVEAVGAGAGRFAVGDRVFAMLPVKGGGGYAEYAVVDQTLAASVPPGLGDTEAAAVPLAALTALQALRDKAGVSPGANVLVNGASGGVGSFAVQVAKAMGAKVTATASGRNADFVRSLGADEFVDYTKGLDRIGPQFDVVFDAVDKLSFRQCRRMLKPGGIAVTTNPLAQWLAFNVFAFLRGGRRLRSLFVKPSGTDLEQIAGWINSVKVRAHVERTFELEEAAQAQKVIEAGRVRGKLALVIRRPGADPATSAA